VILIRNATSFRKNSIDMKKCLEETQTLRAGCKRPSHKISPCRRPFPGARDGHKLISWRWSLPLPTNTVWRGSIHAISSYRGNRPTHTHPCTHKQTGPITIHCAAASTHCKNSYACISIFENTDVKNKLGVCV